MREERGNIWEFYKQSNAIVCITTNGVVKTNGELVMGKGIALEAKKIYPPIAKVFGSMVTLLGNEVHLGVNRLMSFPTKHHWTMPSDLRLIMRSALQLKAIAEDPEHDGFTFYLPRPGCGNGGRDWDTEVKPILTSVGLPDNVVVVTY